METNDDKAKAAEEKKVAIHEYTDAKTKEERAKVVERYPVLKEVFAAINHS